MPSQYDDSPELAVGHDLPEAYVQSPPETVWSPQPSIAPTYVSQPPSAYPPSAYGQNGQYTDAAKPGSAAGAGAVGGVMSHDPSYASPESTDPEKTAPPAAATVCGISLVLLLSIIIAILSAAVIGLAAGTGVATSNYNDANSKLRVLSSSLAAAQAKATGTPTSSGSSSQGTSVPTDWNSITNGCSDNPGDVTGLTYTSQCKFLCLSKTLLRKTVILNMNSFFSFQQCQLYHVLRQGYQERLTGVFCFRWQLQRLHGRLRWMEHIQHDQRKMRGRLFHSRVECPGYCTGRTRSRRLLPQACSFVQGQPDGSQYWWWRDPLCSAYFKMMRGI